MSKTPITDGWTEFGWRNDQGAIRPEKCREMEIKLTAAQSRIAELEKGQATDKILYEALAANRDNYAKMCNAKTAQINQLIHEGTNLKLEASALQKDKERLEVALRSIDSILCYFYNNSETETDGAIAKDGLNTLRSAIATQPKPEAP